jgi:hypothetical protein
MSAGFPTGQPSEEDATYPQSHVDQAAGNQAQLAPRPSKGGGIDSWP